MTYLGFPIVGGISGPGTEPFDQDHFIALILKVAPDWYTAPIESAGGEGGSELFDAFAVVGERLSLAVQRLETGALVTCAPGAARATATVSFERTSGGAAVTVKAGTIVTTTNGDRRFRLLEDVVFGGADNGPHQGEVEAIAPGYEYNVVGPSTALNGEVLPGEIDEIQLPVFDPAYGETTLTVEQVDAASGGTPAMLEGIGADRGLDREVGESEDKYRLRVRSLPDVVTPNAIENAAGRVLDPLGVNWDFIETFEIGYQTCYDAPSTNVGTPTYQAVPPTNPDYNTNLFCYDDPRAQSIARYADNYLDDADYRGAFVIVVEAATILSYGFAYDDTGMQPSDFRSTVTGRQRGTGAYDSAPVAGFVYPAAFDGPDVGFDAATAGLYRLIKKIKAAGIFAEYARVAP